MADIFFVALTGNIIQFPCIIMTKHGNIKCNPEVFYNTILTSGDATIYFQKIGTSDVSYTVFLLAFL